MFTHDNDGNDQRDGEKCTQRAYFPPGTRAKGASGVRSVERTLFFGVTMFASSRFFSARDNHDLELSQRLLRLNYAGFKS